MIILKSSMSSEGNMKLEKRCYQKYVLKVLYLTLYLETILFKA